MGLNEEKYKNLRKRLLTYIKEYAFKQGITQEQIAEQTGFTSNNVNRMLAGRYPPTLDNFIRLAEAVNHQVELVKKYDPQDIPNKDVQPKFMFVVDPLNNQLYILHRQFPSCLIHIIQEIPVRLVIEDLYDNVNNPADILNMPFFKEAKEYWRQFAASIMDEN